MKTDKEWLNINECFFNELELSKAVFEYKGKYRKIISGYTILNKDVNCIITLVCKYMLYVLNIDPETCKEYARKYLVIVIYDCLMNKKLDENIHELFNSEFLNNILNNGITLDDLKSRCENNELKIFEKVFNKDNPNLYKSEFNYIVTRLNKPLNAIIGQAFAKDYEFFNEQTNLNAYNRRFDMKGIDQLICEALISKFTNFEFDIIDLQEFFKNVKSDKPDKRRFAYICTGHLINYMITNDAKNVNSTKLIGANIGAIIANNKEFSCNVLDFFNEKYEIIFKKVNPFKFIYNGKAYLFTQNGINLEK